MGHIPHEGEACQPPRGEGQTRARSGTLPCMGNSLKTLRLAKGWTHDQAASEMGISRGQFIKLERGERKLTERTIALAIKAFGVKTAELLGEEAPAGAGYRPPPAYLGERDLPVFAAAEGGQGEMVVQTDPIEIVQRPWYLKDVRDGYAVLIVGESMVPAFEPGDIAVINPRLPPMRDKDMIFVSDTRPGEFTATVKRLIRWTTRDWQVRQFNPPTGQKAEFALPRQTWAKALRIVGKYYGG